MATTVKRSTSVLTRGSDCKFLIGSASHDELRSKWDDVCKGRGMTSIIEVYISDRVLFRNLLFDDLVQFYEDSERL